MRFLFHIHFNRRFVRILMQNLFLFGSLVMDARAAVFYMDSTGGNNSNSGTTTNSAWQSRPEISAVARELGLSDRTLQRRIIKDGATFRHLLLEARQELAHEYLNRPEMDVKEVAFLLGYFLC